MHAERNKYECFNNLIQMILKICEIALFTRAMPGSSLVHHRFKSCVLIPPASNSCKKFLSTSAEIASGGALHVKLEQS